MGRAEELPERDYRRHDPRYGGENYDRNQRLLAATQAGAFKNEIVPVKITRADGSTDTHHIDEGIRFDATLDGIKVTPANPATAAIYSRRPFVYEKQGGGSWLYWNLWNYYSDSSDLFR